ncbi:MAG: hypothetical protein ACWGNV_10085 [Bacteroidales bacterium]
MKRYAETLLLGIFFFVSCEKLDPNSGDKIDHGSYEITISGINDTKLVGKDINTNWDEESGWIYLGPDDNIEPLGTLTLQIDVPPSSADPIVILDALQTKTDVQVGTSAEINARSYMIREPSDDFPVVRAEITDWEIGANYIKGTIYIDMERLQFYSTDTAEYVTLTGTFTAI